MKTNQTTIRLSEHEDAVLDDLASALKLSRNEVIRVALQMLTHSVTAMYNGGAVCVHQRRSPRRRFLIPAVAAVTDPGAIVLDANASDAVHGVIARHAPARMKRTGSRP
jgi:hypothetical protein